METSCPQVCIHRGTVYPVGQFWEEGCDTCTCTDMEDAVVGLRVAQCSRKLCEESCQSVRGAEGLGTMRSSRGREAREGIPGRVRKAPLATSGSRRW